MYDKGDHSEVLIRTVLYFLLFVYFSYFCFILYYHIGELMSHVCAISQVMFVERENV